jgi:hypothetical protein
MHGLLGASAQPPHHGASREIWARYYASLGWRVFPLHTADGGRCSCGNPNCPSPGKHPRTQNGVKDASDDPEQIRAWWAECPDANVGIATGAASGLVVIDIDHRNGGDESYIQLHQELPSAFGQVLKVRTGSGGTQLYFQHPGGHVPCRANVRPGIDVKADGGYVVAPPSLDVNGVRYYFTSNGRLLLPPLPQALRDLICAAPQAQAGDEASTLPAILRAEHLANSLDETPQEKGEASLPSQIQQIPERPDRDGRTSHDEEPRLLVDNCNPDVTVRELRGILAGAGDLFDRGAPARLVSDPQRGTVAKIITPDALVLTAHEVCRPYVRKTKRDGSVFEEDARLPKSFAAMYLDYGGWGLPPLNGITTAPLLHDDGTIRSAAGYDPASRMWCENVPDLKGFVLERPTRDDALAALRLIRNTFKTFPFADAEMRMDDAAGALPEVDLSKPPARDESSFLVALLTAVCRPSLHLAPGVLLRAPALSGAGTGKGLLARCTCIIAFGREPHAVTAGATTEELEKRISAELMQANTALFIDNVNNTALKSDLLASSITERPARVRVLGKSLMVPLNSSTFVVLTGNGLSVSEDLARRFIVVELDARTENPEARPFTINIRAEVTARRTELLAALLTIWRWGRIATDIEAGLPLGSFEQWCRWVRDPLLALGCQDPVARVSEMKERDGDREWLADLFAIWWSKHLDHPVAAANLDDEVNKLIDPQGRGRQFVVSRLANLDGTRVAGFTLTRQPSPGRWGRATYALKKTP